MSEIKELTFKTENYKRVFVYTGHTEEEYLNKYGDELGAGELNIYSPLDVLRGINDDETKPGEYKHYWCIVNSGNETLWYEVPEGDKNARK